MNVSVTHLDIMVFVTWGIGCLIAGYEIRKVTEKVVRIIFLKRGKEMTSRLSRIKKEIAIPFEVLNARHCEYGGMDVKVAQPMSKNLHIKGKITGSWMSMKGRYYWKGNKRYMIRSYKKFNPDKLVGTKVRVKEMEAKYKDQVSAKIGEVYRRKKQ